MFGVKLVRESVEMHGLYWHEEPGPRGLCWWQYWRGVQHTWFWHGVPIWRRLRKRDRPTHEFLRRVS